MLADRQKNKNKYTTTIKPKIYGLSVNDDLVYIGKTHVADTNGKIRTSKIQTFRMNEKINKLIRNKKNEIKLVEIKESDFKKWYKDRNNEVHVRFVNGEVKLLNSPWMLEGKRCYWDGKVKDRHTIERMSESKHKKIVQYDINGIHVKTWESAKAVGTKIFKDYRVENGSAMSRIYSLLGNKVKNRLAFNSYWFKESELLSNFSSIPKKLNIPAIIEAEKKEKIRKYTPMSYTRVYKVNRISLKGKLLHSYNTAEEAAKRYKVDANTIRKACKLGRELCGYFWEYGEKHTVYFDNKSGKFIKK